MWTHITYVRSSTTRRLTRSATATGTSSARRRQEAAKRFKDARWCLLKKPEKLTDEQAATLARIKAAGGEVWRAYTLKEAVRGIFEAGSRIEDVEVLIDRLLTRLARSRLEPFVRLGKTIRKHHDGILAAIRLGINQGRTEALNNKVRLITRRAYGFHSAKAALALVLLTCGPITLHLPHELHALGSGDTDHIDAERAENGIRRVRPVGANVWLIRHRGFLGERRRVGRFRRWASSPCLSFGRPCDLPGLSFELVSVCVVFPLVLPRCVNHDGGGDRWRW